MARITNLGVKILKKSFLRWIYRTWRFFSWICQCAIVTTKWFDKNLMTNSSGWWFQPLWKKGSSTWESSPIFGMKMKKYLKPPPKAPCFCSAGKMFVHPHPSFKTHSKLTVHGTGWIRSVFCADKKLCNSISGDILQWARHALLQFEFALQVIWEINV